MNWQPQGVLGENRNISGGNLNSGDNVNNDDNVNIGSGSDGNTLKIA